MPLANMITLNSVREMGTVPINFKSCWSSFSVKGNVSYLTLSSMQHQILAENIFMEMHVLHWTVESST